MIMSVEETKNLIELKNWSDDKITLFLTSMENIICGLTGNDFINRNVRYKCNVSSDGSLISDVSPTLLEKGNTIFVRKLNKRMNIETIKSFSITLNEPISNLLTVDILRCDFPNDIKFGLVNLLDWEIKNRDKIGISSESLSRYSVSYVNPLSGGEQNMIAGYPSALMTFLKPYYKARF